MSRKLSTLVLLGALIGVLFVGCGFLDGPLTDVPLAAVPNSIADPRFANANQSGGGGGGAGGTAGKGPRVFFDVNGRAIQNDCTGTVNCPTFKCRADAQAYFEQLNRLFPENPDCHGLDGPKGNASDGQVGQACEGNDSDCTR